MLFRLKQNASLFYEQTKCNISAAIFGGGPSMLIETTDSIFSTREKVVEKVVTQYLDQTGKAEATIKKAMIRGSLTFSPGKTLADYEVVAGGDTLMWVFLA